MTERIAGVGDARREDIEMLLSAPMKYSDRFDRIYGEGAAEKVLQSDERMEEDGAKPGHHKAKHHRRKHRGPRGEMVYTRTRHPKPPHLRTRHHKKSAADNPYNREQEDEQSRELRRDEEENKRAAAEEAALVANDAITLPLILIITLPLILILIGRRKKRPRWQVKMRRIGPWKPRNAQRRRRNELRTRMSQRIPPGRRRIRPR